MSGLPGYLSTLKIGGTATALSSETTTRVTANTVYQITDSSKRVLDTETAVVVEVDADGGGGGAYAEADASTYTLDYLTGTVTFLADQGADAVVRIKSGKYIPLLTVATAHSVSIDVAREELDTSVFSETAPSAIAGRKSAAVSFEVKEDLTTDHDSGAGEKKLGTLILNGTKIFFEACPGGSGVKFRSWVLLARGSLTAGVSDLSGSSLTGRSVAMANTSRTDWTTISWAS